MIKTKRFAHREHQHSDMMTPSGMVTLDPEHRTILLIGAIDSFSTGAFMQAFEILDRGRGLIRIVLNSHGGEVENGMAIYDVISTSKNDVAIEAYGSCQSMAALILQAGTYRYMSPNCRFMVHMGQVELSGPVDSRTFQAVASESSRSIDTYIELMAKACNKSFEDVFALCDQETYLSAEDAIEYGFADAVLASKATKKAAKKTKAKK